MAIFTILILPKSMECFSICLCPLLFPWAVVHSSPWRGPLHPLLVVFLGYFILFLATVNGSSFLIWLCFCLLLVYRNACDFCTLILYPETLLKLLISFRRFWAETVGSSKYTIMSSANRDNLTSSFPNWIPFIFFLAWLLWLELLILYWIGVMREGILV